MPGRECYFKTYVKDPRCSESKRNQFQCQQTKGRPGDDMPGGAGPYERTYLFFNDVHGTNATNSHG